MDGALENKKNKQGEQGKNRGNDKAQQPKTFRFDLLVAVCNQGYAEEVMQAARKAGAGGECCGNCKLRIEIF